MCVALFSASVVVDSYYQTFCPGDAGGSSRSTPNAVSSTLAVPNAFRHRVRTVAANQLPYSFDALPHTLVTNSKNRPKGVPTLGADEHAAHAVGGRCMIRHKRQLCRALGYSQSGFFFPGTVPKLMNLMSTNIGSRLYPSARILMIAVGSEPGSDLSPCRFR